MTKSEFKDFEYDEFIPFIFPIKGQGYPSFTDKDLIQLQIHSATTVFQSSAILKQILLKYGIFVNDENKIVTNSEYFLYCCLFSIVYGLKRKVIWQIS